MKNDTPPGTVALSAADTTSGGGRFRLWFSPHDVIFDDFAGGHREPLIGADVGTRVLIVDDEESLLFTMGDYFGARGYVVDSARDEVGATVLLARARYAAVIADLRLRGSGDTGGLAVLALVGQQFPATRRILLTAYGSPDVEREARRLGVDAYLLKPQPLSALADVVDVLLRGASG